VVRWKGGNRSKGGGEGANRGNMSIVWEESVGREQPVGGRGRPGREGGCLRLTGRVLGREGEGSKWHVENKLRLCVGDGGGREGRGESGLEDGKKGSGRGGKGEEREAE